MASTIQIRQTEDWCSAFIVQRPSNLVNGVRYEPTLTAANKVLQTILSAPFRWAWNRKEINFAVTNALGTDYLQAVSDWGWMEKATRLQATATPPVVELEVYQVLAAETKANPPLRIAPVLDDNAGNITFRLGSKPDQNYQVYVTYQKAPILATVPTATWAPIPDRYAFLYEIGLLAHLQQMYAPQLYMMNMEMFFRQLVGAAEGLTESEKAIFLEDKLREIRTQQASTLGTQQGKQGRV
jgi:hypothetical protein